MSNQTQENRLGVEPILPLLIKLSIPSMLSMTIQALYNVVDSIYLGRFSTNALSALSLAFPLQMVLISIAVGTGVGASSLIARRLGQGENKKASRAAEHTLLLSLVYGLIIGLIGFFFSRDLISIFTDNQNLIQDGAEYIRIIFVGSVFLYVPMLANNILRGEGNTFVPMISMLIGSIINILLDPFLIFGIGFFPRLGVAGAAYATVFSRMVSGIYIVYKVITNDKDIKIDLKKFKLDFSILRDIYAVGLPAMVMQLLGSVMVGGLNIIVGSHNVNALAVVGIYFRLQSFVFMPVFGLNQGYMPIVGYNYGHNNPKRMKETMKYGLLTGFAITTIGFILFQVAPGIFIRLFSDDPELIAIGITALKTISLSFPIVGIAIVGSTTFQAVGRGFVSMLISFLRQIIILLPVAYLLGQYGELEDVWYAFPIAEGISFIVLLILGKKIFDKVFMEMEKRQA